MEERNSHCGYCGQRYSPGQAWPRTCGTCGRISYLNPIPVAVALVPVEGGLLVVRRAIEPGGGRLALPGGYINLGETWQEACARELKEETGVTIQPAQVREFAVRSAPDNTLLVFGLAAALPRADLPEFEPDSETVECLILNEPVELAFSLHTAIVQEYFKDRSARPGPA